MARTKPAVRVHLSVADHDKTAAVWSDLALRGMLVELWRQAGEKWAGKRHDQVPLKPTDRMAIACSTDLVAADSAIETLCKRMRYGLKKYPNRWVVTVRNFAKKNGFEGKELDAVICTEAAKNSDPPNPSPIPIPNPSTNTNQEEEFGLSGSPAPRARVRRSAGRVDPRVQAAWPTIRAAFAEHGTELGESIAIDRSKLIAKRLDAGATPDDLVCAVHGYVRANGLEARADGFDPGKFFRPQTIFKEDGFSDRVDAGRGPRPVKSGPSQAERLWGNLR